MPRLFFALWPGNAVRDQLYSVAQDLRHAGGGRLMRRVNLHQTLVFVGAVAAEHVADIVAAAAAVHAAPFGLAFGATGFWRHKRIVWAAPFATPPPLTALVSALAAGLTRAGIEYDDRPYSAHVTLLRDAREPASLPVLEFEWPVRDFVLLESAQDDGGVVYRVAGRWPLAA